MTVLRSVMVAGIAVLTVSADQVFALTGEAALDMIRTAMAQAGVEPPTMAAPVRALPTCDQAPKITPKAPDWALVELTCAAPSWSRLLRTGAPSVAAAGLDRSSPALHGVPVMTVARPVQQGGRISAADLVLAPVAGIDPAQAIQAPEQALGRRLRVALGPGQPLLERHLDPLQDIEEGQEVVVLVETGIITVSQTAIAVTGGRAGDLIRLQPASGTKIIEAVILGPGRARVQR